MNYLIIKTKDTKLSLIIRDTLIKDDVRHVNFDIIDDEYVFYFLEYYSLFSDLKNTIKAIQENIPNVRIRIADAFLDVDSWKIKPCVSLLDSHIYISDDVIKLIENSHNFFDYNYYIRLKYGWSFSSDRYYFRVNSKKESFLFDVKTGRRYNMDTYTLNYKEGSIVEIIKTIKNGQIYLN